mmetsp:Transcript_2458/g.5197  ORF Transcript_2458/g.5197 Transcript_2458/m.5197 type:complete len:205 (-) Transcript_2458:466-1080(-)
MRMISGVLTTSLSIIGSPHPDRRRYDTRRIANIYSWLSDPICFRKSYPLEHTPRQSLSANASRPFLMSCPLILERLCNPQTSNRHPVEVSPQIRFLPGPCPVSRPAVGIYGRVPKNTRPVALDTRASRIASDGDSSRRAGRVFPGKCCGDGVDGRTTRVAIRSPKLISQGNCREGFGLSFPGTRAGSLCVGVLRRSTYVHRCRR